jgi:phosphohistidine phosphatase
MELLLWRHCHAEDGVPDDARRLSPRGVNDAARVARWLSSRLPASCRIVVSPALRARQTAQALARTFETRAEVGNGATVAAVLSAARWQRAGRPALIVSHQPTLGRVAALLLDGDEHDRPMRAGELLWLSSHDDAGKHVVLAAAITPDEL